jgi:SAM-dependent methyltransferase
MSDLIAAYKKDRDAFGHMLLDYLNGEEALEIIERGDGFIDPNDGCKTYFSEFKDWPAYEKEGLACLLPGRVLDLGCGAGRMELYLQSQAVEVIGIDNSPLAIEVCRRRGVKDARLLPVSQVSSALGIFDNIIMMGNNWGLMANRTRARWLLRKFYNLTSFPARIIAATNDIYQTDSPYHLAYQAYNHERGRMTGQIRMQVCYKFFRSRWFDYLMVSREEMQEILEGTGWRVERFIDSPGQTYMAVIGKEK